MIGSWILKFNFGNFTHISSTRITYYVYITLYIDLNEKIRNINMIGCYFLQCIWCASEIYDGNYLRNKKWWMRKFILLPPIEIQKHQKPFDYKNMIFILLSLKMRVPRIKIIGILYSCFCSAFREKNFKNWLLRKLVGTKRNISILMPHVHFL